MSYAQRISSFISYLHEALEDFQTLRNFRSSDKKQFRFDLF